jgi:hypothetical protein
MPPHVYRVFGYRGTSNLGDAFQTIALCRLLGDRCLAVLRDSPLPQDSAALPLIANGWLGYYPYHEDANTIFAGVHLASHHFSFARWLRRSPHPAGARDPYTSGLLKLFAIPFEMTACATLTFEPYRGPRQGRYAIDAGSPTTDTIPLTQFIPAQLSWPEQWHAALVRLDLLRRAEIVYTSRLHVALPCLAFGTPVVVPSASLEKVAAKERLSLLAELPFTLDEAVSCDISPWAQLYWRYLESKLGPLSPTQTPRLPELVVREGH